MQTIDFAIILGKNQVKNNNHVVKIFTKNYGIQTVFVSAGTKKKTVKSAVLQPLSICQVKYSKTKTSNLLKLQEARIETPLLNIQVDVYKSAIALFIADFLSHVLPQDSEDGFYDFIENSLKIFNEIEEGKSNYHLLFLLKISKWLGLQPTLNNGNNNFFDLKEGIFFSQQPNHPYYLSIEETNIIGQLLVMEWTDIGKVKLTGIMRRKLVNSIIHYYVFHIPGFKKPKALTILEEVFD